MFVGPKALVLPRVTQMVAAIRKVARVVPGAGEVISRRGPLSARTSGNDRVTTTPATVSGRRDAEPRGQHRAR